MKAIIKHNGVIVPEALCIVDTSNNTVRLGTMFTANEKLNLEKVYVEVNLFGELEALEEDEEE